jgi:hypothetical protein
MIYLSGKYDFGDEKIIEEIERGMEKDLNV